MASRIRPAVRKLICCGERLRSGPTSPVDCASIGVDAEYATLLVADYAAEADPESSGTASDVADRLHVLVDEVLAEPDTGAATDATAEVAVDPDQREELERLIATALEVAWAVSGHTSGSLPTWDGSPSEVPAGTGFGTADLRPEPLDRLFDGAADGSAGTTS